MLARNAADRALLRAANPAAPVAPETAVAEPGGRYIDFLIPGLLGINLLGGGLFGVGFVAADLRVRKLLKRFQATPMRRSDFLLSLMLSRLVFTLIDIALLLAFSYLAFDIRVRGNPLALARADRGRRRVLRGTGAADRLPREDDGNRRGADERGDAADVRALGRVLLGGPVPGGDAAVHPGCCRSPRSTTGCGRS